MKYFNEPAAGYIAELSKHLDVAAHNKMTDSAWETFFNKNPERMPMILGINPRYLIQNPAYNKTGLTFKAYFGNSRVMFEAQAEFRSFLNRYVPQFGTMGKEAPINIGVDFQNVFEAGWLGCPIVYSEHEVPYARPLYTEENREAVFEKGLPKPFDGLMGKIAEYYLAFQEYAKDYEIDGKKIDDVGPGGGAGTDGAFTLACELLGPETACALLYEDADYMRRLLDFLTEATVRRIKAFRKLCGQPEVQPCMGFADDSIAMLSESMYREAVLPFHKKLVAGLTEKGGAVFIHLCGDASRHFKTIQDELNCVSFDTGFPIDHEAILRRLRPGTQLNGGPHVGFLEKAAPAEVYDRVKEMALRLKAVSKYFVMREANNLPPSVPLENCLAMYRAVVDHGVY
ncbi:MAG: hypothetical protein FWE62_00900 [Firmicutes bacterium]|nr:hypothetical protein [Bacillota bacterium]